MSHVVEIQTEVKDSQAVRMACGKLGLPQPVPGVAKLFSGMVEGLAVHLPGWTYPVVCQLDTSQLKFDNYGGRWKGQT